MQNELGSINADLKAWNLSSGGVQRKTTSGFSKGMQLKICLLQAAERQLARIDPGRMWKRTREKAKNRA